MSDKHLKAVWDIAAPLHRKGGMTACEAFKAVHHARLADGNINEHMFRRQIGAPHVR